MKSPLANNQYTAALKKRAAMYTKSKACQTLVKLKPKLTLILLVLFDTQRTHYKNVAAIGSRKTAQSTLFFICAFFVISSALAQVATDISCNNNGTISLDTDDFISFKLNPTAPSIFYVGPYTYDVTATQGGIVVAIELPNGDPATGISFGYDTKFNVVGSTSGAGDLSITITPTYGGNPAVVYSVTDPGNTCSANCAATTGNTVSYSYETLIGNSTQIHLPKFELNSNFTLTAVDITYTNTYTNGYIVENLDLSAPLTATFTGVVIEDISYAGTQIVNGNFTFLPTTGIPIPISIPAGITVPAQGLWTGDDPGFNSTLIAMSGTWLGHEARTGVDFTLDPRWVTNITTDATTDNDIVSGNIVQSTPAITLNYTTPADLANFTGTGDIPIILNGQTSLGITGGIMSTISLITSKADFQITYTYDCASATIIANNDDFTGTPLNPGDTTPSVFDNNGSGADDSDGNSATDANINDNINITLDGGLVGVSINSDGTIKVPANTPSGTYTVTYEICLNDPNSSNCDTAETIIKVEITNLPPIADDDTANTTLNTPVDIDVLTGDNDPDGDNNNLTITEVFDPANPGVAIPLVIGMSVTFADGTQVVLNANGTLGVTPPTASTDTIVFDYTLEDEGGLTDVGEVILTISNVPPTADDDASLANVPGVNATVNILDGDALGNGTLITNPVTQVTIDLDQTTAGVQKYLRSYRWFYY